MWIQILIPQVEDFKAELSLEIQEGTLAEIRGIEAEVANYLDHIYKYYAVRGKLVSKLAKYPHVVCIKLFIIKFFYKNIILFKLNSLIINRAFAS